jgi:hypothetical protein
MYFFLEEHKFINDSFHLESFEFIQVKNLNEIKKFLINSVKGKAKEIRHYYDNPYHVFDFLDLNDINYVIRFGKVSRKEVDDTLKEFDDVKVITL